MHGLRREGETWMLLDTRRPARTPDGHAARRVDDGPKNQEVQQITWTGSIRARVSFPAVSKKAGPYPQAAKDRRASPACSFKTIRSGVAELFRDSLEWCARNRNRGLHHPGVMQTPIAVSRAFIPRPPPACRDASSPGYGSCARSFFPAILREYRRRERWR